MEATNPIDTTQLDTQNARGTAGRLSILQPLAQHDFRLMWIGQSISLLGDQFHFVALPWLTLQLTGSGLALGTVLTAAAIPRAIFMLVGGVLSDRFAPRVIMLLSNAIRAVLVGILTVLVVSDLIQLWHLYLLSLAFGLIDALFYPASMAIVPMLVDDEKLEASNSLVRGTQMLSVLVGPAPAGVVIAAAGLASAFGFDTLTFVAAAFTLWLMKGGGRPAPLGGAAVNRTGPRSVIAGVKDGVRYAWHDPVLRALLIFVAVVDFSFAGPVTVGLASLADNRFLGAATAFGIMLSAWGGGALLGTVVAGSLGQIRHRGKLLIILGVGLGIGLAALGFTPNVIWASAIIAAMGVGSGFVNVAFAAWLQRRSDPGMLGRVMSLVMFASVGLSPISYTLAGAMVDWNLTLTFVAAGVLVLVAGVYSATNRAVRTID